MDDGLLYKHSSQSENRKMKNVNVYEAASSPFITNKLIQSSTFPNHSITLSSLLNLLNCT